MSYKFKVYVASSWRNARYPEVLKAIREDGYDAYDFRNPAPGDHGFSWSEIDPNWRGWTTQQYVEALKHPAAKRGFRNDMRGLDNCEFCVLVMPCGRSAHLEAGYAQGAGKPVFALWEEGLEAELMHKMLTGGIHATVESMLEAMNKLREEWKELRLRP